MKTSSFAAALFVVAMLAAPAAHAFDMHDGAAPQQQGKGPQGGQGGPQGGMMMHKNDGGMGAGGDGSPANDPQAQADRKAEQEKVFQDRKSEILMLLKDKISELQRKQSCVESAASFEALANCGPGGGHGGMMMHKGDGGGMGMGMGDHGMRGGQGK